MIYSSALSVLATEHPRTVLDSEESLTDFIYPDALRSRSTDRATPKPSFPITTIDVPFSGSLRPIQKDVEHVSPGS
jgi:hypothetical protein